MTVPAIALIRALESDARNKTIIAGLKGMIEAYFLEYTDATEVDPESFGCLGAWFDICFPSGETDDGQDLEAIINEVKAEMKR